ncbi:LLM class flavin-dependent oxidoreductase [Pseudactinotalea sp.]|uniref:LLM class flavin-dependent oxidoreductase n=1 Tax=Pseudactinotalea sp. TaxID=1926260 RepID=UPI003B39FE31
MKFGCCVLPPQDPMQMRDFVHLAAELGYDRLWLADQTFHADPFVALADAARESDLPLGLALTNPFTRHPVQIARAIATLRHLTGRTNWIFALGASNPRHVLAPLGMELRNAATQTGTALTVIRDLLRGERVTCVDPRLDFQLSDVALEVDPCDDVELYLGTRGPRMLQTGGRVADGVIVEALFTPEAIAWAKGEIATGQDTSETGQPPSYVAWQITEVLEPGEPVPEHAAAFARHLMSTTHESVLARLGFDPELTALVKAGDRPEQVPDWAIKTFAAMDTSENLRERVRHAAEAGAEMWSCSFTGPPEETGASMRRFAEQVIAPLRAAGLP